MGFFPIYFQGLLLVLFFSTLLWLLSIRLKNVSIVDIFWGMGYVIITLFYFLKSGEITPRKVVVLALVVVWGMRLSIYLYFRNKGKPEDFRYQEFRRHYGTERYWWFSFFQVFLLQGSLIWLISAPLLATLLSEKISFGPLELFAIAIWLIGFIFEAGGDWQLARFKAKPENKGKVLQSGFWKYTRHPNYFGDTAVWWGFGLLSIASGSYLPFLGSLLMTWLIIRISGVLLLEKTLKSTKPEYIQYVKRTSAFIPWFPKNKTQ